MTDIANVPKMSDVLKEFGFKTGGLLDARFKAMDEDRQAKLDAAIATLSGKDTQIMGVLEMIQRITDAEPGTVEFNEGQNLYSLMQTNYLALGDRLTANENLATSLETWRTGFVSSYTSTIQRIDAAIALEVQTRTSEIERVEALIKTNADALSAANLASAALKTQLEATDASQSGEITALKSRMNEAEAAILARTDEITGLQSALESSNQVIVALQTKQENFDARITEIESKFLDFDANSAVAEFAAGLRGQTSPAGFSAAQI